ADVAARKKDELFPAIERVWDDCVAAIRADLRTWLQRMTKEDASWTPERFELAFGLPERGQRDAGSRKEAMTIAGGLQLRGSIDLVEKRADGVLRATDYKSGKQRMKPGDVIQGGK